jgi:small subunit ribosomal protein S19
MVNRAGRLVSDVSEPSPNITLGDNMSSKVEPMYRGVKLEELAKMSMDELIELLPTRRRRTLKRGLPPRQKKLLAKMRAARKSIRKGKDVVVKTHCRDMVILPEMVDITVAVHNGKEFVRFKIIPQMIGHVLGEMSVTTRQVKHGNPGIGATKSSQYVPLK